MITVILTILAVLWMIARMHTGWSRRCALIEWALLNCTPDQWRRVHPSLYDDHMALYSWACEVRKEYST